MSTIPYETEQPFEDDGGLDPFVSPGRPRRRFSGKGSAILLAVLLGAVGFYAGVRVEKGQMTTASTGTGSRSLASIFAGAAARGGAATSGAGSSGAFSRFSGGGAAAGAGGSVGTVSAVNGHTVYLRSVSGNTIKVSLNSATKITKSEPAARSAIRPGDAVVIRGASNANGTLSAASVSDSGASASAASGGSTAGAGASGSSGSGVASLFGATSGG
jgi:Domain of unknown function (DUF5666)